MDVFFYGKLYENIRKCLNLDILIKSDTHRKLGRQSKLSFNNKIGEFEKFILFSFKKESRKNVKLIYIGYCVLDLSNLMMYEWYFDKCNHIPEKLS